jgi:hypothetical protein
MASPCSHCGNTKTESVRHGFIYNTLWSMGYHLRRCSFCNRWRLLKRVHRHRPHPDDVTVEELQRDFMRQVTESRGKTDEASKIIRLDGPFNSAEESTGQGAQPGSLSSVVAEATDEDEGYRSCPRCRSTVYRRSHRRWYERLIKRHRMARCMKCNYRFPYPQ